MHYKSWFWSIFLWSFFDYCSCLLRNPWFRSYSFIYFPVPARWLSWEPNSVYCSIGTILLYSWNLSKSCDYISKASNTLLWYEVLGNSETPNEVFFNRNPKLLGLGRQIGKINSRASWVFSALILVQFFIILLLFLQKTKLLSKSRIFIRNWDFNLGRKELGI